MIQGIVDTAIVLTLHIRGASHQGGLILAMNLLNSADKPARASRQ